MKIKKSIVYLVIVLLFIMLCGCGNKNYLSNNDFVIDNDTTSKNITIGDSNDKFIDAYSNIENDINVRYANDNNHLSQEKINNIDFSQSCTVSISGIDIDGTCIPVNKFIKEQKINIGLDDWFNQNSEYLEKHNVTYKVLAFSFENNIITDIRYIEKQYTNIN